eukprot:CAMPEP_0119158498 /NCGR_PEP_ID=MMETSP1310-20130426/53291_1 /TAXON_ID=464262 /ORGANISM="Genus nov. species nov., Strain RCC2339" /LENGTH=883 /DNA_ID=CAMNT_0007151123 /DNA_START=211 /DNA_END=2860 /DNA_ORIENTATION=-
MTATDSSCLSARPAEKTLSFDENDMEKGNPVGRHAQQNSRDRYSSADNSDTIVQDGQRGASGGGTGRTGSQSARRRQKLSKLNLSALAQSTGSEDDEKYGQGKEIANATAATQNQKPPPISAKGRSSTFSHTAKPPPGLSTGPVADEKDAKNTFIPLVPMFKSKKVHTSLLSAEKRKQLFATIIEGSKQEVVRLLKKFGKGAVMVMDENGNQPIHVASEYGHDSIVSLFLKTYKAPVDPTNATGHTPLHLALRRGHLAASQVLLEHGADVMRKTTDGTSTLHLLAGTQCDDPITFYRVASLLASRGVQVNESDNLGNTALHVASRCDNVQALLFLSNMGGNVEAINKANHTALYEAVTQHAYGTALLLIELGAETAVLETLGRNLPEKVQAAIAKRENQGAAPLQEVSDVEHTRVVVKNVLGVLKALVERTIQDFMRDATGRQQRELGNVKAIPTLKAPAPGGAAGPLTGERKRLRKAIVGAVSSRPSRNLAVGTGGSEPVPVQGGEVSAPFPGVRTGDPFSRPKPGVHAAPLTSTPPGLSPGRKKSHPDNDMSRLLELTGGTDGARQRRTHRKRSGSMDSPRIVQSKSSSAALSNLSSDAEGLLSGALGSVNLKVRQRPKVVHHGFPLSDVSAVHNDQLRRSTHSGARKKLVVAGGRDAKEHDITVLLHSHSLDGASILSSRIRAMCSNRVVSDSEALEGAVLATAMLFGTEETSILDRLAEEEGTIVDAEIGRKIGAGGSGKDGKTARKETRGKRTGKNKSRRKKSVSMIESTGGGDEVVEDVIIMERKSPLKLCTEGGTAEQWYCAVRHWGETHAGVPDTPLDLEAAFSHLLVTVYLPLYRELGRVHQQISAPFLITVTDTTQISSALHHAPPDAAATSF